MVLAGGGIIRMSGGMFGGEVAEAYSYLVSRRSYLVVLTFLRKVQTSEFFVIFFCGVIPPEADKPARRSGG